MIKYKNVIFVCESGTTVSPLAAAVFNRDIPEKQYQAKARGLVVLFPEPANPKAVAVAKSRGLDLESYMAKQLEESDFGTETLVLVENEKKKSRIYEDYKGAVNVFSVGEFTGTGIEMHDPYGEDLQGYGTFLENLEPVIGDIIYKLYKEEEV